MSLTSVLLYPLLLLFPAADGARAEKTHVEPVFVPGEVQAEAHVWPPLDPSILSPDSPVAVSLMPDVLPDDAAQVRIEQRMIIRITPPRASVPMPDMFVGMPDGPPPQMTERKIGNCLSIAGIASVRPDRANRLLLLMRDRRVVSAELDRSCRARDFYSGFLLERSEDGRLCVDRDTLLSRSGMTCTLTRIRQLVEDDR